MKAIIPPRLSNSEMKALAESIRRQCVEETGKYEVLLDAVVFNEFAKVIGYDQETLKKVYDSVYNLRERAAEQYKLSGLQPDMAAFLELQMHGIDIMKWHEDKKAKFEAVVV